MRPSKAFAVITFLTLLSSFSTALSPTNASEDHSQHLTKLAAPNGVVTVPGSTSTVLRFTAVPNATSYKVRLYAVKGENPLRTIAPFNSGDSVSALTPNSTYKITVQAIGNNTTFSNSPESGKYSVTTFASTYAIIWSANGGASVTAGPSTYTTGLTIGSLPATTTKDGYTFDGWWVDSTFTTGSAITSSYTPASPYGAVTFYAKWSANTTNAITWDDQSPTTASSGGSAFYTTAAAVATIPTVDPIKTGYSFGGWFTQTAGAGTQVTNGSYTPASPYGAITFYAKWSAASPSYSIGDTGPGGGIIYYYDSAGFNCGAGFTSNGSPTSGLCHYLEVAPSGWNTGSDPTKVWAVSANQSADVSGISNDSSAAYNNALGIGLGYKNSDLIVAQGNDTTTASGAARAYAGGSKNDWYLPTTAELNLLCQWDRGVAQDVTTACTSGTINTGTGASGGFVDLYYWSSSETSAVGAWVQGFGSSGQYSGDKGSTNPVRPVRAF